jgi:hypothetical protein
MLDRPKPADRGRDRRGRRGRHAFAAATATLLASGCFFALSSPPSWSANTFGHCGPWPVPIGNSIKYGFTCNFQVATIDFQDYLAPPSGDPQWPGGYAFQNDQGFVCGPNNPPDSVIHCTRSAPISAGQPISGTITTPRSPCTLPSGAAAQAGQGILIDAYSGPPPATVGAVLTNCPGAAGGTSSKACKKKGHHKKKRCGRKRRRKK